MKNKYERMSKEEKKSLYNEYKLEKVELSKKIKNMLIICGSGVILSIIMFVYDYFFKDSLVNYIIDIILCAFCILSFVKVNSIKKDLLNKFALEKENKYKKSIVKKYKK